MAVVQISRIQIRRGKLYSETGLPQLASGEMAWTLDSQELFIGNGAVSEGAPAVGNTKILTSNDLAVQGNLLALIQHTYRAGDPSITTGPDANSPIYRPIQARLDDSTNTAEFGTLTAAYGDGSYDDTPAFQRAIDQLFLNPTTKASDDTAAGAGTRVILEVPPGIYNITSTLYVPSFASIVGAGAGKTIISFTGTGPVFQFVNDTSEIGSPSTISSTLGVNQPRNIILRGMTIHTQTTDQPCLQLDAVRNSTFENLTIQGDWTNTYSATSNGIELHALSDIVTCEQNIFKNITISGFSSAVFAKQDISNNTFDSGLVTGVYQGFVLGAGADETSTGEQYGPRETEIINYKFIDVMRHAVYVELGSNNITSRCTFVNVGNDSGPSTENVCPQVYFGTYGNDALETRSDRTSVLSAPNQTNQYIPEVGGYASYTQYATRNISFTQVSSIQSLFRLPVSTDAFAGPIGTITYVISYFYKSTNNSFSRRGTMTISADIDHAKIQLSDEYDYAGTETHALNLDFSASFLNQNGGAWTGAGGALPYGISVNYLNSLAGDAGNLTYTYTAIS